VGIELVKAVVGHPSTCRLSGNAYKVLVCMATTALDKAKDGRPGGLYWGGWDALAITLGHPNAEPNTTGKNAVQRAVSELRKAGHITPMMTARHGSRQSYLVHPGGLAKGEQNAPLDGEQNATPKGSKTVPHQGSKTLPPRTNTGDIAGLRQDEQLPSLPKPQTANGDNDEPALAHKFKGSPSNDCLDCGGRYANRRLHPLHLIRGA